MSFMILIHQRQLDGSVSYLGTVADLSFGWLFSVEIFSVIIFMCYHLIPNVSFYHAGLNCGERRYLSSVYSPPDPDKLEESHSSCSHVQINCSYYSAKYPDDYSTITT